MYAKVFTQMYDGTLCTKGPWQSLVTFQQLLVLADQDGNVDMTTEAIARRTTIPLEIIETGIQNLLLEDKGSRTPTENGKRIIPLSEGRDWGWHVVNYKHYRALKREEDRREYHREYWHKRKLNTLNSTQQPQPNQPIAEAEAEAEAFNSTTNVVLVPKSTIPECPHQEILQLWAEVMPDLPQHDPTLWPNSSRSANLRSRWRTTAAAKGWKTKEEGMEYLRKLFLWCRNSPFLMGKVQAQKDRRTFELELSWLVNATNWTKVHEGKFHG